MSTFCAENQTTRVELRYSFGDICLYRTAFNAHVEPQAFNPDAPALSAPPDMLGVPDGVAVHCCQGQRLTHPLPALHPRRNGFWYIRNQTVNYYIALSNTFEDYLQSFSSKTRSTLQRKVRKIAALDGGTLDCRAYRKPDEATEFHGLARAIALKTYQERLFNGAIPDSDEFLHKLRLLAEADLFRGFILFIKGQPISYLYVPVEKDVLIYGYLGYAPEYAQLSPGTVLLYVALQQLFAERKFRYFDFTYGENQTKSLFGRASFFRADLYFFRWGVRNGLAVVAHALTELCSRVAGRCLDALCVRERVRKLLRGDRSAMWLSDPSK